MSDTLDIISGNIGLTDIILKTELVDSNDGSVRLSIYDTVSISTSGVHGYVIAHYYINHLYSTSEKWRLLWQIMEQQFENSKHRGEDAKLVSWDPD